VMTAWLAMTVAMVERMMKGVSGPSRRQQIVGILDRPWNRR